METTNHDTEDEQWTLPNAPQHAAAACNFIDFHRVQSLFSTVVLKIERLELMLGLDCARCKNGKGIVEFLWEAHNTPIWQLSAAPIMTAPWKRCPRTHPQSNSRKSKELILEFFPFDYDLSRIPLRKLTEPGHMKSAHIDQNSRATAQ